MNREESPLESRKRGSAKEKIQRLAIEAGKILEFDYIYPVFPAFAFGDEGPRTAQPIDNLDLGEVGTAAGLAGRQPALTLAAQ